MVEVPDGKGAVNAARDKAREERKVRQESEDELYCVDACGKQTSGR